MLVAKAPPGILADPNTCISLDEVGLHSAGAEAAGEAAGEQRMIGTQRRHHDLIARSREQSQRSVGHVADLLSLVAQLGLVDDEGEIIGVDALQRGRVR